MQSNVETLRLYYAQDIKRYAMLKTLTKSEIEDLKRKTRYLFSLGPDVDVERYILNWSPEDFIVKVENEIDKICNRYFEAMEEL